MPNIVTWLLFIFLAAFAVSVFFWFRLRKASRFQGRLTLYFFLFVIIPLAPLALFIGKLMVTSAETFMLPGVEAALTRSLETFRRQLNIRGQLYLDRLEAEPAITSIELQKDSLSYFGSIQFYKHGSRLRFFTSTDSSLSGPADLAELDLDQVLGYSLQGKFYSTTQGHFFEAWRQKEDSSFVFVGFSVPAFISDAKDQVSTTLSTYTALALLGETMVQGDVIRLLVVLFVLFIALVSALLARTVSAGISGPIRKLTEGMEHIAGGDLSYRVQIQAKDEVAYLVDSFNNMAEELKTSREKLQRAERAAAWRDVARQVSHEIKNPLTPIEFSIYRLETTLASEGVDNVDLRESLRIIKEEITSLRRIADTFSKFAKMPHEERKPCDIVQLIKESAALFQNSASRIKILLEQNGDIPPITLDAQQMKSVFHNLIKNAIEASEPGSEIYVRIDPLYSAVHHAEISIKDKGCGMDEQTKRRIFDPYFTTKHEGSGIGLFLAHRIITDHGGDIFVESKPGAGTTFTVRL